LGLQTALDIDVNVLLFVAWIGAAKGVILDDQSIDTIEARACGWNDSVVRRLRTVRQSMKLLPEIANQPAGDLRKDIAALELRAEQIEQALLFEAAETASGSQASDTKAAIHANVMRFVTRQAGGAVDIPDLSRLIDEAAVYSRREISNARA
jgi:uncharacterized protein (TIGR02444 family)